MRFVLSSKECELLLAFEQKTNLEELSGLLHKDISVLSRNLKSIAEKSELLEKRHGKWVLTAQGRALNMWTKEAIVSQQLALKHQESIKIAVTREFASRVLLPSVRSLTGGDTTSVSIIASDAGIEKYLLSGQADFGFDCGRPYSPTIAYKRLLNERFVVVAAPSFVERHNVKKFSDLPEEDHLKFMRSEAAVWDLDTEGRNFFGTFTDIASLRDACLLGYGWMIVPFYMVKKEIAAGSLVVVLGKDFPDQKYGIWWLRERKNLVLWLDKATKWLLGQDLG